MTTLLKLEELGLFCLSLVLFADLPYGWGVFVLLILAPDLGMLGYLRGPRIGAAVYNVAHHRGLAVALYAIGVRAAMPPLALAGAIMLGHASLDRVFGYGLKHPDAFQHTHLGWIGRGKDASTRDAAHTPST